MGSMLRMLFPGWHPALEHKEMWVAGFGRSFHAEGRLCRLHTLPRDHCQANLGTLLGGLNSDFVQLQVLPLVFLATHCLQPTLWRAGCSWVNMAKRPRDQAEVRTCLPWLRASDLSVSCRDNWPGVTSGPHRVVLACAVGRCSDPPTAAASVRARGGHEP